MPKYGLTADLGERTKKGTLITDEIFGQAKRIHSDNVRIAADNTEAFKAALHSAVLKGLEAVGLEVQRIASDQAPVDTGRLAASITHSIDPVEPAVYIGTNVEYAEAQELGTSRQSAANGGRGYLRPAVTDNKPRIDEIFRRVMMG